MISCRALLLLYSVFSAPHAGNDSYVYMLNATIASDLIVTRPHGPSSNWLLDDAYSYATTHAGVTVGSKQRDDKFFIDKDCVSLYDKPV